MENMSIVAAQLHDVVLWHEIFDTNGTAVLFHVLRHVKLLFLPRQEGLKPIDSLIGLSDLSGSRLLQPLPSYLRSVISKLLV